MERQKKGYNCLSKTSETWTQMKWQFWNLHHILVYLLFGTIQGLDVCLFLVTEQHCKMSLQFSSRCQRSTLFSQHSLTNTNFSHCLLSCGRLKSLRSHISTLEYSRKFSARFWLLEPSRSRSGRCVSRRCHVRCLPALTPEYWNEFRKQWMRRLVMDSIASG
jgi:hypothetical protein